MLLITLASLALYGYYTYKLFRPSKDLEEASQKGVDHLVASGVIAVIALIQAILIHIS